MAAVPKLRDEEESVKVTVFPETEIASIGPDEAKVKAGPLMVAPWAVIVVVAAKTAKQTFSPLRGPMDVASGSKNSKA